MTRGISTEGAIPRPRDTKAPIEAIDTRENLLSDNLIFR